MFRNSLDGLITNGSLSVSAGAIVRQRRNAASALSRGVEAALRQSWRSFTAEASYPLADSRFSTRERIPQVPRHQGSARIGYLRAGTSASFGMRAYSLQFDDDRNQLVLPGFATLYLTLRREFRAGLSASVVVDNLTGREYPTGFSSPGVPTVGSPRLWRAGLRWGR